MQLKPVKVIARIIVVAGSAEVLLVQRSANDNKGALEWEVPGGLVEEGEDFSASAQRELLEETGIVAKESSLTLAYTYTGDFGNGLRILLFFVLGEHAKPEITLSEEHEVYEWVPFDEAVKRELFQHHEHALEYIQQNMLA